MGTTFDGYSASQWLEVFKTTETADRRWKQAVHALAEIGLLAVPALIEATGDEHPEVRREAAADAINAIKGSRR